MAKARSIKEPNTVLVAIMNDKKDYARLQNELWYRIPVDKAPPIIRNRQAKIIAFYPTAVFKEDKWKIRHYGFIRRMTEVSRQDLFPEEPANSLKANRRYYKIELEELLELSMPIISRKGHRLTFVPTSEHRFFNYTDLNYLFNTSPLEDSFFQMLNKAQIPSERQWWLQTTDRKIYILDFAIFCKLRPINVECDGDTWHDLPDQVHYDKRRNNELESKGWSVLRFTSKDIRQNLSYCRDLLFQTINRNGGYEVVNEPNVYKYLQSGTQLRFDF